MTPIAQRSSAVRPCRPLAAPVPPGGNGGAPRAIVGALSGKRIVLPDVDARPMPAPAPSDPMAWDATAAGTAASAAPRSYPDARSFARKFALIVPATNTSMEHDLWSIVVRNQGPRGLRGVGLHTTSVVTPRPRFGTPDDLASYRQQFVDGLRSAIDVALLAQPHYMIMGMSLEHILGGLDAVRAPVAQAEAYSGRGWAAPHDALAAALRMYGAKRIGLLTPFDRAGNASAVRTFEDLGYEVVSCAGFACADAVDIAHVPDWAKEQAILERLATPTNALDAVVQCGTNMGLLDVAQRLEPVVGIPILPVNAATFWYALRENGFDAPLEGAGRLLREH